MSKCEFFAGCNIRCWGIGISANETDYDITFMVELGPFYIGWAYCKGDFRYVDYCCETVTSGPCPMECSIVIHRQDDGECLEGCVGCYPANKECSAYPGCGCDQH